MRDARMDQVVTSLGLWVLGSVLATLFAFAPSLLPVSAGALGVFAVTVLVVRGRALLALTGGSATALGLLFLYFVRSSIESCAAYNQQPGGGCEMGDSTPFVVIALLFLALGVVLSSFALRSRTR